MRSSGANTTWSMGSPGMKEGGPCSSVMKDAITPYRHCKAPPRELPVEVHWTLSLRSLTAPASRGLIGTLLGSGRPGRRSHTGGTGFEGCDYFGVLITCGPVEHNDTIGIDGI